MLSNGRIHLAASQLPEQKPRSSTPSGKLPSGRRYLGTRSPARPLPSACTVFAFFVIFSLARRRFRDPDRHRHPSIPRPAMSHAPNPIVLNCRTFAARKPWGGLRIIHSFRRCQEMGHNHGFLSGTLLFPCGGHCGGSEYIYSTRVRFWTSSSSATFHPSTLITPLHETSALLLDDAAIQTHPNHPNHPRIGDLRRERRCLPEPEPWLDQRNVYDPVL